MTQFWQGGRNGKEVCRERLGKENLESTPTESPFASPSTSCFGHCFGRMLVSAEPIRTRKLRGMVLDDIIVLLS